MPKRRNPFGDCSPMQFKVHVGKKEVDMGVAQDRNMKQVYDKTRQLLMSGSKKSFNDVQTDINYNQVPEVPISGQMDVAMEEECPVPSGQLQITATGALTSSDFTAQSASKEEPSKHQVQSAWSQLFNRNTLIEANSCQCCKGQAASQDRCGFCDRPLCGGCLRMCMACSGPFCELCSVLNYDAMTERSFCLSCAS